MEKPRHRRNNPSFSSSLLDAIDRSIDGGPLTGGALEPNPHFNFFADSAPLVRPRPIRTQTQTLTQARPDPPKQITKKSPTLLKKKLRDLKPSSSSSSSSPSSKIAGFISSLFTASSTNPKKPKISTPSPSTPGSSTSSRSCLSKTPSTHRSNGSGVSKRSVRFCPTAERVEFDGEATARRRMIVEEILKGIETESDDDDDDDDDDESDEDLFELENLAGIGGRFRDELPVFETTDLGMNRAIEKSLVV